VTLQSEQASDEGTSRAEVVSVGDIDQVKGGKDIKEDFFELSLG